MNLLILQSEMRHRLIMELTAKRALQRPPQPSQGSRSLALRAGDSLVADYLSRRNLEYTLSVFVPEAGLSKQKVSWCIFFAFAFSNPDALSLFHFSCSCCPVTSCWIFCISIRIASFTNHWWVEEFLRKNLLSFFHISSQCFDDSILLDFSSVGTIYSI